MLAPFDSLPDETRVGTYLVSNYPPVGCWKSEFIPKFLHALILPPVHEPLGLYVHLPFCRQRCHYCSSHAYPCRLPEDVDSYIDAVLREFCFYLRYPALQDRPLTSVYIGGGSPAYLSAKQMTKLFRGLQDQSSWEHVRECTVDSDPGSLTTDKLKTLQSLGVTRLSMGIQSFDDTIMRRNGRNLNANDCIRAFVQARQAGFTDINFDLLAGLPGETGPSWRRTVDRALELHPDSISIYQLELAPNSSIYAAMLAGRQIALPTWPEKRLWTNTAFQMCEEAGYTIISSQIAARDPGWRSVHVIEHVWHGADLLALGESATGHIHGVNYQNVESSEEYLAHISTGKLPLQRAFRLRPDQRLRREVVLLLKSGKLDLGYFRKKYKIELLDYFETEFQQLIELGFLDAEGDQIRATREGLLQVDWLLSTFYQPGHCSAITEPVA